MLKITKTVDAVEEDWQGVTLKIRRSNNNEFVRKFRKVTAPYKRQLEAGSLDDDKSNELVAEAMAGTILVGWSGFVFNDQEVPYSIENAVDLLMHDKDCREFVSTVAGNLNIFLQDEQDATEGN